MIGEGAGVLVLEELEHAQARGAHIYAEMAGNGMSSDAFHMTLPDESGEAQARAVIMALDEAGIDPSEVDYINAHGTSTGPGDIAETRAIKQALGDHAYEVAISSNKSMIGHCLGAAGALEAVATVLTIVNSLIPPTINLTRPGPRVRPRLRPARVPVRARSTSRPATASASAATTWPWSSAASTADRRRYPVSPTRGRSLS